ncbi:hypothetical protein [Rathayibacter rathayi]|nr:hypothetical protein [Rathayibacter rathayi]TWD69875.1 hypothetical protein FB469_1634 [Rathayibacter rathayi]SOE02981.1 hypothetical protein SAMN06295924_1028 [Rathayibacter rathayi NCPPB 2980 = VKM Ac-1601]
MALVQIVASPRSFVEWSRAAVTVPDTVDVGLAEPLAALGRRS